MNGFYDTAVIMPNFQSESYNYEYRSDESEEEFVSDDDLVDTPIFMGACADQSMDDPPTKAYGEDERPQAGASQAYPTQEASTGRCGGETYHI